MSRHGRAFILLGILATGFIPSVARGVPDAQTGATDQPVASDPQPCATDDSACLIDLSLRQVYRAELAEKKVQELEDDLKANEKEAKAPVNHHNFGYFLAGLGTAAVFLLLGHKLFPSK